MNFVEGKTRVKLTQVKTFSQRIPAMTTGYEILQYYKRMDYRY